MIETGGLRPEALVEAARRRGIMIRQGTYHTARFGERFVKVSTSVPVEWAQRLCAALPDMVRDAAAMNDVPPQF